MIEQLTVGTQKRRDFSGFETRIEVTGAPRLKDGIPPYRLFNPEAVLALYYAFGHWSGEGRYVHVTVVGGCVDDHRRPGRVEWTSTDRRPGRNSDSMPDWIRELIRDRTGITMPGQKPSIPTGEEQP